VTDQVESIASRGTPVNEDQLHAQRVAEAAGAVELRGNASGGHSMRIRETVIRWRREETSTYAQVKRRTTICFAAGSPEPTVDIPIPTPMGTRIYATGVPQHDPLPWLADIGRGLVARLGIASGDQLLVATNQTFLRFRGRSTPDESGRAFAALADMIESLPLGAETGPAVKFPRALGSLRGLVEAWALRDDGERTEAIAAASDADLESLWRTVSPLLPTINELLDDGADRHAWGQSAGHLAQAALEAQLELERRDSSRMKRSSVHD
jgi:hypothetical protein